MLGIAADGDLVTSFQAASYIDGTTQENRGIPIAFPARRKNEARWQRQWMYMCLPGFILRYTWVYSPANFPISNFGFSQRIKAKQVFIVFDWKEDTSVKEEEEGKGNSY